MDIYVPPQGGGCLFESDLSGETIPVDAAERYVSIALCASAGPDISATINQLTFGFQPGVEVSIANYQKFETQPEAPTILEAVQTTVASFCDGTLNRHRPVDTSYPALASEPSGHSHNNESP